MAIKKEYTLKDHQLDGVKVAIKRDGNILFSHPVGSGKTFTSIAAFEELKKNGLATKALVVTPASLRENYGKNGVEKFTDSTYAIFGNKQEASSDKTGKIVDHATHKGSDYGIVSYELFREDPEKYIKAQGADTVIFDEIHRIKNDESKTFKALKESRKLFKNFIGMTGSIVSNTPADVVPLIDAMTNGDHRLGTKSSFENRFVQVDSKGNKIVTNPLMVRMLMAPYVHHVDAETIYANSDVKPPRKEVHVINVDMSAHQADLYRYVIDKLDPITKMKLKHSIGKMSKAQLDALFTKLIKTRQISNSVASFDKEISLSDSAKQTPKAKKLLDDVETHLKDVSDAQVVIHSNLLTGGLDVVEQGLKDRGIQYGKFIGKGNTGITEKARQQDVADYNAGKLKVLLISSAGGEGLDLPNTTLFASMDGHFNPEKINQAEARGVRLGGLSHRPEKERKVIVNRYISKLPLAKSQVALDIYRNLNVSEAVSRYFNGEEAFYNPFRGTKSVDEMVYEVAAGKAKGNDQLKGLFKQAAEPVQLPKLPEYNNSDRKIMKEYLDKYQETLLTGDHFGKYIDEPAENKYIEKLKDYYTVAATKNVNRKTGKEYAKYKDVNSRLHFLLKEMPMDMAMSLVPAAISVGSDIALASKRGVPLTSVLKKTWSSPSTILFNSILPVSTAIGGYFLSRNPIVSTSAADAKSRKKLSNEQLLSLLRGENIRQEVVKVKDNFIKVH